MNAQSVPGKKKAAAAVIALPYWLREFGQLRLAALGLAAAAGLGAALVLTTLWYRHDAADALAQAQQTRDAAYARFAHVENEKQEIRAYQPRFIALRARGMIGEENRLDWVEAVRQVQERRRLPPLSYEIDPQQPVRLEAAVGLGEYRLHASRMRLHMDLLHEMDLFNFLADLRARSFYAAQDCSLKRLPLAQNVANAPTLAADCTLNWLTLTPAAPAPVAAAKKGTR